MPNLRVKDGDGSIRYLKTTVSGSGTADESYIPHHIIQGVSGSVVVTSSNASPVYVTPTNSSVFTVTSSLTNRLGVTGTVQVNNFPAVVTVTSSVTKPVYIEGSETTNNNLNFNGNYVPVKLVGTGSTANFASIDSNNRLLVSGAVNIVNTPSITASLSNPVGITGSVTLNGTSIVTASLTNPVGVTGSVTLNGVPQITASLTNPVGITGSVTLNGVPQITSSFINPLAVTGTVTSNVNLNANQTLANVTNITNPVTITSSQQNPVYTLEAPADTVSVTVSSSFNYSAASGTFMLCPRDSTRKELFIHNPGPANLYVVMSSTDKSAADRFGFTWAVGGNAVTASVPNNHSLIVYPSGTFISTEASRTLYYGGFFVSQSSNAFSSLISITTMK